MKLSNYGASRKMRHGSVSVGITAAVICAVLLINVLLSALYSNFLLYIDTTTEPLYTLDAETEFLLDKTLNELDAQNPSDEKAQVDIIFCADPDLICANERTRAVYYTALQLQKHFPKHINVSHRDVWDNPSSVDEFRTNAYSTIRPSYVIVSSGSEFRLYTNDAFYMFSSADKSTPLAYNGEKTFVKGIMAVTRASAPICALTTNHGEPFATADGRAEYSEFLKVIESAGYEIVYLDLEKDEIPDDCRLIVTMDPQRDFASNFQSEGVSEVSKLEAFLDKAYSFLVFADADTPKLTNLEEYMEEWGIVFDRYNKGDALEVVDPTSALAPDGKSILAQYQTEGSGGSLTKEMRENTAPPKIVFGNALSISYSHSYERTYVMADEENNIGAFTYGKYKKAGLDRNIYSVFTTTDAAYAYAKQNGEHVLDANGDEIRITDSPFNLMTVTENVRLISEGVGYTNAEYCAYVCAIGSTEFANNHSLASNAYGNTDLLLNLLRSVGKEVVPVGLDFKVLHETAIDEDYNPVGTRTVQTVLLVVLPAAVVSVTGSVILIKRKFRK